MVVFVIAAIIFLIVVVLNLETTVDLTLRFFEKLGLTHRTHHWDDVE